MFRLAYLRGALGDTALLMQFSTEITHLLSDNYTHKNLEKLKGHNVFSYRLNDGSRLLFTIQIIDGQSYLVILEYLPTHQYHRSRFLNNPQVLRRYLERLTVNAEELPEFEPVDNLTPYDTSVEKSSSESPQVIEYYHNQFLKLTDNQQLALEIKLPGLVGGVAGSGKSFVVYPTMIEKLADKDCTRPLLYIAPSDELANSMRNGWLALHTTSDSDKERVEYMSYKQFVMRFAPVEDKKKWFDYKTWINWCATLIELTQSTPSNTDELAINKSPGWQVLRTISEAEKRCIETMFFRQWTKHFATIEDKKTQSACKSWCVDYTAKLELTTLVSLMSIDQLFDEIVNASSYPTMHLYLQAINNIDINTGETIYKLYQAYEQGLIADEKLLFHPKTWKRWYASNVKKNKIPAHITSDELYKEFFVASGYTKEQYIELGSRHSVVETEYRAKIFALSQEFKSFSDEEPSLNSIFYQWDAQPYYGFIFADEGPHFSNNQLDLLFRSAVNQSILMAYDPHQRLSGRSNFAFIQEKFNLRDEKPLHLDNCIRCPTKVINAANVILKTKQILQEGLGEKWESRHVEASTSQTDGIFQVVENLSALATLYNVEDLVTRPDCAFVVNTVEEAEALSQQINSKQIHTPFSIQGLEYDVIIAVNVFDHPVIKDAARKWNNLQEAGLTQQPTNRPKAGHDDARFGIFFNQWYTLFTRARRAMIVVQTLTHFNKFLLNPLKAIADSTATLQQVAPAPVDSQLAWEQQVLRLIDNGSLTIARQCFIEHLGTEVQYEYFLQHYQTKNNTIQPSVLPEEQPIVSVSDSPIIIIEPEAEAPKLTAPATTKAPKLTKSERRRKNQLVAKPVPQVSSTPGKFSSDQSLSELRHACKASNPNDEYITSLIKVIISNQKSVNWARTSATSKVLYFTDLLNNVTIKRLFFCHIINNYNCLIALPLGAMSKAKKMAKPISSSLQQINDIKAKIINKKFQFYDEGTSPLMRTIIFAPELVEIVVNFGADINYQCLNNSSPLMLAIRSNSSAIVQQLLERNADITITDKEGHTPFMVAAKIGECEIIDQLASAQSTNSVEADKTPCIDRTNHKGQTALEIALFNRKNLAFVKLMSNGANTFTVNSSGNSLLHQACDLGNFEIAGLLLDSKKNDSFVNLVNNNFDSALHIACASGNILLTELLIQHQADIYAINKNGNSPLQLACERTNYELVKLLIDRHRVLCGEPENLVDITYYLNQLNSFNVSPLMAMCHIRYINERTYKAAANIVKLLIEAGANIYQVFLKDGVNDIHNSFYVACEQQNFAIAKLLLEEDTRIKKRDPQDSIESSPYVDSSNMYGLTALHVACINGDKRLVEFLLANSANINMLDSVNASPLHYALPHPEIVKILVCNNPKPILTIATSLGNSDKSYSVLSRAMESEYKRQLINLLAPLVPNLDFLEQSLLCLKQETARVELIHLLAQHIDKITTPQAFFEKFSIMKIGYQLQIFTCFSEKNKLRYINLLGLQLPCPQDYSGLVKNVNNLGKSLILYGFPEFLKYSLASLHKYECRQMVFFTLRRLIDNLATSRPEYKSRMFTTEILAQWISFKENLVQLIRKHFAAEKKLKQTIKSPNLFKENLSSTEEKLIDNAAVNPIGNILDYAVKNPDSFLARSLKRAENNVYSEILKHFTDPDLTVKPMFYQP